jgi:hypothetical protein
MLHVEHSFKFRFKPGNASAQSEARSQPVRCAGPMSSRAGMRIQPKINRKSLTDRSLVQDKQRKRANPPAVPPASALRSLRNSDETPDETPDETIDFAVT